ncbi:MAG: class D beta-lactamase [Bacteroidota bacterium]|jgi:beta-lactamase class D
MITLPIILLIAVFLPLRVGGGSGHGTDDPDRRFREAGVTGSFLLCELEGDSCLRINPDRCARSFIPASTFKILNSLIALEDGVIKGLDDTIRWDGKKRSIASWNQDQCMRDAFQRSCVWFYQELARRIGEKRMKNVVKTVEYGNGDIGGGIDRFWLDGALRISSEQQVAFLRRLWKETLPFSSKVQGTVKDLMLLEKSEEYTLRGKTGTAIRSGDMIGWLVGFLESRGKVYVFALNIEAPDQDDMSAFWTVRLTLTKALLRDQGLI